MEDFIKESKTRERARGKGSEGQEEERASKGRVNVKCEKNRSWPHRRILRGKKGSRDEIRMKKEVRPVKV